MSKQEFGSPVQVKIEELKQQFGGSSATITINDSNDVSKFLSKMQQIEEKTKEMPELKFK